jgi:glycerol kinase
MKYVLAIDQGTTGTRALLINQKCEIICSDYMEHRQIYPKPGWVEHDPVEIWNNVKTVVKNVLTCAAEDGISDADIKGIGIDNQGETVMLWDKNTGIPCYNAIVWQCRRTADYVEKLKQIPDFANKVLKKTGLVLDSYFSATKIKWIIQNVPGVEERIARGEVLAGTLDTWLIWKMTKGRSFLTDVSTAARTMLFNINEMAWDDEILEVIGIPRSILAAPVPTSGDFGQTDPGKFCGVTIPICGSIVDQPASLFGHGCFDSGMVKNTYGTGCFLYMNIGNKPVIAGNGILTTVAWQLGDQVTYAYDGGVYVAGTAIQWLRDGIGIIEDYSSTDAMAKSVNNTGGVVFVPVFSGLAAPFWDQHARGLIIGLTGGTKREHIIRATLESIGLQVKDVVDSMNETSGKPIKVLRADGGITKNDFAMQFQADVLGIPVEVTDLTETTAMGAGYMAGLACGVWSSLDDINKHISSSRMYLPQIDTLMKNKILINWREAVKRCMKWDLA